MRKKQYDVLVMYPDPDDPTGWVSDIFEVEAEDYVRAGIAGRRAAAERLGEDYDPDRHKVCDVAEWIGGGR